MLCFDLSDTNAFVVLLRRFDSELQFIDPLLSKQNCKSKQNCNCNRNNADCWIANQLQTCNLFFTLLVSTCTGIQYNSTCVL